MFLFFLMFSTPPVYRSMLMFRFWYVMGVFVVEPSNSRSQGLNKFEWKLGGKMGCLHYVVNKDKNIIFPEGLCLCICLCIVWYRTFVGIYVSVRCDECRLFSNLIKQETFNPCKDILARIIFLFFSIRMFVIMYQAINVLDMLWVWQYFVTMTCLWVIKQCVIKTVTNAINPFSQ